MYFRPSFGELSCLVHAFMYHAARHVARRAHVSVYHRLSVHPSVRPTCWAANQPAGRASVRPSVRPSVRLVGLSVYLCLCLWTLDSGLCLWSRSRSSLSLSSLSVCPYICLAACLLACLLACLCLVWSVWSVWSVLVWLVWLVCLCAGVFVTLQHKAQTNREREKK